MNKISVESIYHSSWRKKREFAKAFFGNACMACDGKDRLALDHIEAWSVGGSHLMPNLQILCISCNSVKSADYIDYRHRRKWEAIGMPLNIGWIK